FDVVGVDIEPHPDYPFELTVADAMTVLADRDYLDTFDAVHASPPCPRYSVATQATRDDHPDLVGPVRDALTAWGGTWAMENVPGAPMPAAVLICGQAMGLRWIRRHRLFESNAFLTSPGCACGSHGTVSVFGHSGEDRRNGQMSKHVPIETIREVMGIDWMTRREDISDAIPPAYTEHIGQQLIDHLARAAA